jgi:hypothetical protein
MSKHSKRISAYARSWRRRGSTIIVSARKYYSDSNS